MTKRKRGTLTSRKITQRRIVPTKSDIVKIIKNTDDSLLRDDVGRIYGVLKDEQTVAELMLSGEINGVTRFAMWVFLPTGARGPYATSSNRTNGLPQYLLTGDDLILPEEFNTFKLYNYRTDEYFATFQVMGFIDKVKVNARVAAIVVKRVEEEYEIDYTSVDEQGE